MRTNIDLNDELLAKVMERTGLTTKKAAVEETMRFYLQIKQQGDIRKLFGKVKFYDGYDYKAMRGRVEEIGRLSVKAKPAKRKAA